MTLEENYSVLYLKAKERGDIHEARYYRNLLDALYFDTNGRHYDPSEFGGWNHGKG
ncbi:unknown [Lactococcus phage Q54]|uniref:Uncharacterized protein n=1 Tax=Lactococcus phage Q54 TaxID=382685 RepID=Q0GXW7_9CAUD|nr:hypothetical protein Q54_gp05 [Lactococcus phage Q54]ABF22559.1 unknown [Lactococcus phage Q54]